MKISVVIPVFDSEKTIGDTLLSVKSQTYLPYEIILVNDGSSDNSKKIINNFTKDNSHLNIIYKEQDNKGVSVARNVGMRLAKGDWIALLDSDDTWHVNKLEKQVAVIKGCNVIDFLGTTRNGNTHSFFLWKRFSKITKIGPKLLLIRPVFATPTVIFKTNLINTIGMFDEGQTHMEDAMFFMTIAQRANSYLLNESLVRTGNGKADFGESGLSGNLTKMQKGDYRYIQLGYKLGVINFVEYLLIVNYSSLKFVRRWLIVKLRKLRNCT